MNKFLILLLNEGTNLKNTIRSICSGTQQYPHWSVAVIGGKMDEISRIIAHRDKFEYYANCDKALDASDADVVFFMTSEDEIVPGYLQQLDAFFTLNESIACYSNVRSFTVSSKNWRYSPSKPIKSEQELDVSQIAWKTSLGFRVHHPEDIKIRLKGHQIQFTRTDAQYRREREEYWPVSPTVPSKKDFYSAIEIIQQTDIREHILHKASKLYPEVQPETDVKLFTAIIAAYGAKDYLEETIRTMIDVGESHLKEIIVIDSSHLLPEKRYQDTVEKMYELEKEFPIIRYIQYHKHSHGKKLDRAIRYVTTPYTLISDSDVHYYDPELFFEARCAYLNDPKLFMIGNLFPVRPLEPRYVEAEKLEPYALFVRTDIANQFVDEGVRFYRSDVVIREERPGGRRPSRQRIFYDTAALMFHKSREQYSWKAINTNFYRHLKHGSWPELFEERSEQDKP